MTSFTADEIASALNRQEREKKKRASIIVDAHRTCLSEHRVALLRRIGETPASHFHMDIRCTAANTSDDEDNEISQRVAKELAEGLRARHPLAAMAFDNKLFVNTAVLSGKNKEQHESPTFENIHAAIKAARHSELVESATIGGAYTSVDREFARLLRLARFRISIALANEKGDTYKASLGGHGVTTSFSQDVCMRTLIATSLVIELNARGSSCASSNGADITVDMRVLNSALEK